MTRLAFDMSSYIKTGMLVGTDTKDGVPVVWEGKNIIVPSAEYGYENVTNMMVKTLRDNNLQPCDCLLVFEGLHSKSKRLLIDSGYKGSRDKRPPEFYEEFIRLRDYIEGVWRGLGAIAIQQDYAEADDTLAWLARETEEDLIIASRDGDLGVLNGTNAHGAKITTYNDGLLGVVKLKGEPFVHPFKYITLYKALVGDDSDSIPGVKGFGPKSFQKLAEQYGYDGLDELMGLLAGGKLDALYELEGKEHKLAKLIVAEEAAAVRSWKLAKLYPEWVNTMKQPVKFRPGKVEEAPADADERLADWYGQNVLITAENYKDAMAFFVEQVALSPETVFDIETSTPDESDDWLKAQGNADGVDQLGSVLTGFSFTFGINRQYTYYVCVDHRDTDNIKMSQARKLMEVAIDSGKPIVIHNNFFELSVLGMAKDEDGTPWTELWKDKGARGFMPNSLDTKLEASYVDENIPLGLKFRSKHHLNYEQETFEKTTTKEGRPDELPPGGKLKKVLETEHLCACGARGFEPSRMHGRCEFCDGTEGGCGPTKAEVKTWNLEHEEVVPEMVPTLVQRQYKMRELTGAEVFAYGADDTICTSGLHNFFKLFMQLEHTWKVYLDVEIDASYQHAKNFIDGIPFSLEKMRELEKHDTETYDKAWGTVRAFLMEKGWAGTTPPLYEQAITAAQIKEAYAIVKGFADAEVEDDDETGVEDEEDDEGPVYHAEPEQKEPKDAFLSTKVRTPSKLVALARELGHETFAGMVEQCLAGEHEKFTSWVREQFSGEPLFKISNKQLCKLLYEVMALPIRVRNKPTAKMRLVGAQGNPKGDALAIEYALRDATPEQKAVLESLKLMQMVRTRRSLYYSKYPYFVHWLTGRIHPTHNQSSTNTRRASESKPNKQQLPKHPKITGEAARFRETIVPHHPDAVVVSADFDSQELRVIADYSQDTNMVACFVGDNKKSMHSLTGHSIALKRKKVEVTITYEEFDKIAKGDAAGGKKHPLYAVCAEHRALGKKVNFTTEFGAMAPKLAMTMLCTEEEAQAYIDAKEDMFPGVRKWKNGVIEEAKRVGFVRTKEGAVRHLAQFFNGDDHWLRSKAERQSVNFKVQSSSGEMTKKAEARVWRKGLVYEYDAVCYGPVHDEILFSVMKKDLAKFMVDIHWCMTQPYGGMTIPIETGLSFGPSFGQQIEIGIAPTPEAVAKGLEKMAELEAA